MKNLCFDYLALQNSQSFMFAFKMSMCHFQFCPQQLHLLHSRTVQDMTLVLVSRFHPSVYPHLSECLMVTVRLYVHGHCMLMLQVFQVFFLASCDLSPVKILYTLSSYSQPCITLGSCFLCIYLVQLCVKLILLSICITHIFGFVEEECMQGIMGNTHDPLAPEIVLPSGTFLTSMVWNKASNWIDLHVQL